MNTLQVLQEMIEKFDDDRQLRTEAKMQIQKVQVEYKRNFDKRRKDNGYKIGDLVAKKRTQFCIWQTTCK